MTMLGKELKKFKFGFCLFVLTSFNFLFSLTIGSDLVPSRQGIVEFSGEGNKMLGFAVFENGFSFQDSSTTCSYDALFLVSGAVNMRHGSLFLFTDLFFDEGLNLISLGNIYGGADNYKVDFPTTVTAVTSGDGGSVIFDTVSTILHSDIAWQLPVTFRGESKIDGSGHEVSLEENGGILVDSGGSLTVENLILRGFNGNTFSCVDDTAKIFLKNCFLCLDHDFTFENGSLLFYNNVVISGTNQFNYTSIVTSTIESKSTLKITDDAIFRYAPTTNNRDLIYMTDETSCLHLNCCTLRSTETGLRLINGKIFIENNVTFSCDGGTVSESICFGNGIESNDVEIVVLSGAELNVYGGLHYDNVG